jgi:hypothetical protein
MHLSVGTVKLVGIQEKMFEQRGWQKFDYDINVARWSEVAQKKGLTVLEDPKMRAKWLQCAGTWFVGVDALPSDPTGRIGDVDLKGTVIDWLSNVDTKPLHPAQLSVMFEGYPKPREGENKAAFGYRLNRDAAHVDGLLPVGKDRRRMLKEPHAYILGLPLNETSPEASPLVVWEGSHIIMAEAFQKAFEGHDPQGWNQIDVTEIYQAMRKKVFETCRRVTVHALPGEAYVLHRLALHGVAPWVKGAVAPEQGRMIAYLRPELADLSQWPFLK